LISFGSYITNIKARKFQIVKRFPGWFLSAGLTMRRDLEEMLSSFLGTKATKIRKNSESPEREVLFCRNQDLHFSWRLPIFFFVNRRSQLILTQGGDTMRAKDLFKLAEDPRFISGIYNYCDRWCERCPFTARCLVYAQEQQDSSRKRWQRASVMRSR
jgi:hypothetical protein